MTHYFQTRRILKVVVEVTTDCCDDSHVSSVDIADALKALASSEDFRDGVIPNNYEFDMKLNENTVVKIKTYYTNSYIETGNQSSW